MYTVKGNAVRSCGVCTAREHTIRTSGRAMTPGKGKALLGVGGAVGLRVPAGRLERALLILGQRAAAVQLTGGYKAATRGVCGVLVVQAARGTAVCCGVGEHPNTTSPSHRLAVVPGLRRSAELGGERRAGDGGETRRGWRGRRNCCPSRWAEWPATECGGWRMLCVCPSLGAGGQPRRCPGTREEAVLVQQPASTSPRVVGTGTSSLV